MWILASSGSLIGFSLGTAVVGFFLIRHARQRFARQSGDVWNGSPAARSEGHVPQQSVRGLSSEVARGQVQLHETARELMGQLDTKMRALQVLMRMADESCRRLEAAVERAADQRTPHELRNEP